ncbi:uncharacterized protein ATNIH1004_007232 [Aspergillus tanneri]|uniref:Glycosyl transferase family 25 domain-containing protein n=1 Tax=Aspergillus tanneri TaxID=1220188 RepID=A0A5M9MFU2_9EURO|nr:uncharacterized protein ATNIH1004_007232 [Aspergillus tanneri]KAA8645811.1 hypothetical protein ATNIH1004_007232 [Aspergillus tanneri]
MSIIMTRRNPLALKIFVAALCSYFVFSLILANTSAYHSTKGLLQAGHSRLYGSTFERINNETLGFEKVFAIGLKERTDKRDFLSLAASVSNIKIDWIDGVKPDSIVDKALPEKYNTSWYKPTVAACWRAHMNTLLEVVNNRYSTALILEDDADWDVTLRQQLREFARGVRTLTNNRDAPKQTPYGVNWDILWVGGCSAAPGKKETNIYAVPNDPTVAAVRHRRNIWGGPSEEWKKKHPEVPEDSTRYIFRAQTACCTYGYAVTYEGARRIIAQLSLDYLDQAVDNSMSDLCAGRKRDQIQCYGPYPNIIGTYKPAGYAWRGSDIENYNNEYHEASSQNTIYSTRLNIHRLIAGGEDGLWTI